MIRMRSTGNREPGSRREKRYKPEKFTFDVLKEEYGIYAIRGPRGIPNSLSAALK